MADEFAQMIGIDPWFINQADWMRHYGPVWPTVQAAKKKYDPKNVLTPGHGMFPA